MKKVDSLVSRGLCVVGVAGVSAWAGTNEYGGKTALSDWRDIALNGRLVYIVYDNDIMEKKEVHRELSGLKEYLEYKGAKVRIVYLPQLPGLEKVGVDDFLAHGHTVDAIVQHASSGLRALPQEEERDGDLQESQCVEMLAKTYAGNLLFSAEYSKWFACGVRTPGIWSPIEDGQMHERLRRALDDLKTRGFSWSFLQGCERMLRAALGKSLSRLPAHMIPFQNGILDTTTMGMLPHDPERLNTWCIPYDYDKNATCEPVQKWMEEALEGQKDLVDVLRAYLRAILAIAQKSPCCPILLEFGKLSIFRQMFNLLCLA
jgi:hypothetical protein